MTLSIILPPKIETTDFSTNDFGHAHTFILFCKISLYEGNIIIADWTSTRVGKFALLIY